MPRFFHPDQARHGLIEGLHMLVRHHGLSTNCNLCALAIAQAVSVATTTDAVKGG